MAPRILLVDDNQAVRQVLASALNDEGFEVLHAGDGNAVLDILHSTLPDLVVMNSWLPSASVPSLCESLRDNERYKHLPIILLVADEHDADQFKCAPGVPDDYLVVPFPPVELTMRVKDLLRRVNPTAMGHILQVGDLTLDQQSLRVHRKNNEVRLGPTEFKLLECLMGSPGHIFTRAELMRSIWGEDGVVNDNAINVHIGRLRKSIYPEGLNSQIRTVRGSGYVLDR
ncbi:Phosphate regulon transcriptional regulatory protein PhoB [Agrobacterium albertimagni AOL15]|uniref:Phosphate regulon transcriptional regulatory protein PhoB n=1 Tax=Agrobacterium albertimagni AOL15 TaxID=1156935 RepID=K2R0Z7_9HYPH|nr:winged helix-turn-helix domain-containing protein [Agrobacterium albertimagni]EKF61507.1 Phosphate regulon transcriptional regulatory protein PhoB [Agrobacterium albertimagni AOL15]